MRWENEKNKLTNLGKSLGEHIQISINCEFDLNLRFFTLVFNSISVHQNRCIRNINIFSHYQQLFFRMNNKNEKPFSLHRWLERQNKIKKMKNRIRKENHRTIDERKGEEKSVENMKIIVFFCHLIISYNPFTLFIWFTPPLHQSVSSVSCLQIVIQFTPHSPPQLNQSSNRCQSH